MDLLIEALKALGLIAGTVAVVILAPLVFVIVFSLVSGFNDSVPGDE
jgi:Fe2+ transport system protein B